MRNSRPAHNLMLKSVHEERVRNQMHNSAVRLMKTRNGRKIRIEPER